ncbi:MAG: ComEC/Rec2 family competence protein [Candidatus Pacebacteria bacterium]|nr:ComEC/Rec2 family competence protein [Candidatus Paceibacterota bacterium]
MVKSFVIGFIIGILGQSLFAPHTHLFLLSLVLSLVSLFFIFLRSKKYLIITCALLGISTGLLRFSFTVSDHEAHIFDAFTEEREKIAVRGTISSDPVYGLSYTEFVLNTEGLFIPGGDEEIISTKVLVRADSYQTFEYGERVLVQAIPQKPQAFETETERIFNYDNYLAKDSIYYIFSYAEVNKLEEGKKSLQRSLYRLKTFFLSHAYRSIPNPESGFLAGILFGEKSALSKDYDEAFRVVGLSHIVVLSGYNMSVVVVLLMSILSFLRREVRSVVALCGITAFALLVGAGPTVVRASLMASLLVIANLFGREYRIDRALIIAGVVMVVFNPRILLFDISFQLSFLATYGLIKISPWMTYVVRFLPTKFLIRESASATLSAQLMVTPLILYKMGNMSLISPLANILVLPIIPLAMGVGFLEALVSMVIPVALEPFAFVATIILRYPLWIAKTFSSITLASFNIPPFHWALMILAYVLLLRYINKFSEKQTTTL